MAIMIEIEDELQPFASAVQLTLATLRAARARTLGAASVDYAQFERELANAAAAIERSGHEVLLRALDLTAPEILVDGVRYRKALGPVTATYYTMAGPVSVPHTLYRPIWMRQGRTVNPVSLRVGVLGQGWLPLAAQAMAFECQRGPSREAEKASAQTLRLPYSRSAFDDLLHLVGAQYAAERHTVEPALIKAYAVPAEAASVSVSLDRVSVPMEEPRARPVGRPKKDAPKHPIERNFRMAYAATITLHDEEGKALHTLRYGRMPAGDIDGMCRRLQADVLALLSRRPDLKVVLLCDGAPEMWNLLTKHLNAETLGREVTLIVDFWHTTEKLGKASRALMGDEVNQADRFRRWRLDLLNHSGAAERILKLLQESGREHLCVGESEPVHEAITYLVNHRGSFDYAAARRAGLPIGSGNVEATCKSLFEVRMKRSGCRWKETTGGHLVDIRALALSDRYDDAMRLAMAPLRREVTLPLAQTGRSCAA